MPAHAAQSVALSLFFRRLASATVIAVRRAPFGLLVNTEGALARDFRDHYRQESFH